MDRDAAILRGGRTALCIDWACVEIEDLLVECEMKRERRVREGTR